MRNKVFIILVGCLFWPVMITAQDGTGANFLKIGVGPRQVGLGGAFAGVGDDLYTIYWNPGGLGFVRQWELSAMYDQYFADIYYGALSGVKQFRFLGSRKTTVGGGLFYLGMPEWDSTEGKEKPVSANNTMGIISVGQRLDWLAKLGLKGLAQRLSIGANFKTAYSKLANFDAWTFAADIGLLLKLDFIDFLEKYGDFSLGFAVQNLGKQQRFSLSSSPLPRALRGGLAYRFIRGKTHNLLMAFDVSQYRYGDVKFSLGAEYWLWDLVGIRSGYQINGDDLGDFSFGVSLRYSGFATGLQSDYTRSDFGQVMGYTQKGAMSLRPVSPEPFRLFLPADESLFNLDEEITLEWEEAPDPDAYDKVVYEVILKDEKGKIISSHKTENTHITLPNPGEGTYRWSVKAIDRDGHARFGTGSAQERTLYIKSPDLVVEKVEFIPITRLTPKDDPSQGTIRVQVTNKGQAHSGPFKVAIFDYSAEDRVKIGEKEISGLQPGESQLYTLSWRTSDMGKHRIQAVADVDNMVTESKRFEDNNSTDNSFWTVPKGKLIVRDTTKIERTEFSYIELPVIPFVFFDSSLAVVSKEYYRGDVCDPILPYLKILSDTLKAHPDIIIYLTGFINSDERLSLARERAEAVKQILIDTLGVPQEQIQIVQPANPRARRIEPRKEIWDKKTMAMINEENRRVEFSVEGELKLKHQEIVFGPITLPVEPTIRVGVISDYEVESAMGCVIWQLEVKDKSAQDLKTILAFSALPGKEKIIGQIPWNGNDQEGNPVPVDEYYSCKFEIEDELGRKFETMHYPFYLTKEVTAIRGEQIIALNEFDAAKMTYPFYAKRLVTIAAALKADSTLRVRFKGHTCCLGTQAYNDSLSYERAVALKDLFLAVVRQHFPDEFDTISKQVDLPTWWPKDKRSDCARGSREPLTIAIKGCPEEVLYGNNDTPVGRTLNRRAEIILYQKPISMEVAGKR